MKKTAMQLLIEQLEEQKKTIPIEAYQKGLEYAIQAAKLKIEKEREQIEEAYVSGDLDYDKVAMPKTRAKEYYKDTYQ
jgi:hypothetical protein